MKVSYIGEQRRHTIATFRRLKSYTKTIRTLGCLSLHTLYNWTEKRSYKNLNVGQHRSPKFYLWTLKLKAVTRATRGEIYLRYSSRF